MISGFSCSCIEVDNQRKDIKRHRRKQIIALRRMDPMVSVGKGTWYFLIANSLPQMFYCLKRMGEPCKDLMQCMNGILWFHCLSSPLYPKIFVSLSFHPKRNQRATNLVTL